MLFNSIKFLIFFPIVTIGYFLIPFRFRWLLLLIASCLFYMAFIPKYILFLFLLIGIDFTAGIMIEQSKEEHRKIYLIISILSTCAALFVFKYFNFFNNTAAGLSHFLGWHFKPYHFGWVLPIGLSFHTFQSLSYVIEVYKGRYKAERNLGIYALYVMFYPQLVAGPIERPYHLLPQFYKEHSVDYERITGGLKLMAWGFFKKAVIADRLAIFVNNAYADHNSLGITYLIATIFFAFQIYCDFSGYTDIAIGAAKVMGFELIKNFDRPYIAKSLTEFWHRWHISLSTWFRDYVYISLGGNRTTIPFWILSIMITFIISGLWHGANWTFVIWGALNGFYMVFGRLTSGIRDSLAQKTGLSRHPMLHNGLKILTTFLLVCMGWVFFRAKDLGEAAHILKDIFYKGNGSIYGWLTHITSADNYSIIQTDILNKIGPDQFQFGCGVLMVVVMLIFEAVLGEKLFSQLALGWKAPARWLVYYGLVIAIIALGVFNRSPFIYFQF